MKISVIIPVYGVEKYLNQCVKSVVNQSYADLEVILVDDDSPDSCPSLCDAWQQKDGRLKVIHKENGGLSDARNAGMKAATGEYVLFLDGDDFWGKKAAIERLVARVQTSNADVLNFSYAKYDDLTKKKTPYFCNLESMPLELKQAQEQKEYLTSRGLYIASACNKLIRRTLLLDDLFFEKGVYSEDIVWCLKLFLKAKSMDFVCENFYCYRQHGQSITHTINRKKCEDLTANILACFRICRDLESMTARPALRYVAYQYGTFFKIQALAEAEIPELIERLSGYAWILEHHSGNRKLRTLHLLCRVMSFQKVCRLLRVYYQKKRG